MSVSISKKYLKREEDTRFYPTYIIAPPAKVPELDGYVLKISKEYVTVDDKTVILSRGNEWNKKEQKIFYTFEKEIKEKGKAFKRYRYEEDELLFLYRQSESKNFEKALKKRENISTKGPGSLIQASFTTYHKKYGYEQETGWFVMSKADEKWVYPLDYDPLRDLGKHSKQAKGFTILEEYPVQDIAILRFHAEELTRLIKSLNSCRSLIISELYNETFAEYLVRKSLYLIPTECCEEKKFKSELLDAAKIMEEKCQSHLDKYKKDKIEHIAEEIKNLIGIDINQNF